MVLAQVKNAHLLGYTGRWGLPLRGVRHFRAFLWLRVFSAPKQNPRPPQPRSTQTINKKRLASHRSFFIPIPNFQSPFPLPPKSRPTSPAPASHCDRDTADGPLRGASAERSHQQCGRRDVRVAGRESDDPLVARSFLRRGNAGLGSAHRRLFADGLFCEWKSGGVGRVEVD